MDFTTPTTKEGKCNKKKPKNKQTTCPHTCSYVVISFHLGPTRVNHGVRSQIRGRFDSSEEPLGVLFSFFSMTRLVVQGSILFCVIGLFGLMCHIIKVFKKMACFDAKRMFVYIIHIYIYHFSLKNYAHNVIQYGVK